MVVRLGIAGTAIVNRIPAGLPLGRPFPRRRPRYPPHRTASPDVSISRTDPLDGKAISST